MLQNSQRTAFWTWLKPGKSWDVSPITNLFFLAEWPRFELDFMIFHGMRLQYGDNVGGWFWFQGIYFQLPIVQIDWV